MFVTVFRRLAGNKWKAISLLVGLVLAVAIAFSIPVYGYGILQRVLIKNLDSTYEDTGGYPTYLSADYKLESNIKDAVGFQNGMKNLLNDTITRDMELSVIQSGLYVKYWHFNLDTGKLDGVGQKVIKPIALNYIENIEEHINVTTGRMYNPDRDDGVVEVVVHKKFLIEYNLLLNEVYEFGNVFVETEGKLPVEIVGIIEPKDPNDLFWFKSFDSIGYIFTDNGYFEKRIAEEQSYSRHVTNITVYSAFDYNSLEMVNAAKTLRAYENAKSTFLHSFGADLLKLPASDVLESFVGSADTVFASMLIVIIPIFSLLGFYIIMVSRLKLDSEQDEISVMQSRGASRLQILKIYFIESLLLSVVAVALGIPLGLLLCRIIGASNGFLEFVNRTALNIFLKPIAFYAAGITALLFMLIIMIPAFIGAGINIVESKKKKNIRKLAFYHRYFLDVLFLGAGLYGYNIINKKLESYNETRSMYFSTVENSDFLMYISVVIFALGCGMLFLRLYPYLIKLIFKLGKKIWPSWMYFSLNRTGQSRDCSNIMLFLVVTISIGIFSSDAARSINNHIEMNVRVKAGSDVVYSPIWKAFNPDTGEQVAGTIEPGQDTLKIYDDDGILIQEIPIVFNQIFGEELSQFDEIESASRVYTEDDIKIRYLTTVEENVDVMLIDPYDFAMTANSSSYMNDYQINDYINAMLTVEDSVILSNKLMKRLKLEQGDEITIIGKKMGSMKCKVIAGVDSWPGIQSYSENSEGYLEQNNFVIAHISTLFETNKVLPYDFWIKKADGVSDQELFDVLNLSGYGVSKFDSVVEDVVNAKNEPVLQGTNGLLSVSFITSVVICAIGFLTYWIISIKRRTLQFGISRALGVTKIGLMLMLITEQLLVSGVAVLMGFIFGRIGSFMFVPMLGLNYMTSVDVIPFVIKMLRGDIFRILIIMGAMLAVCFAVLSGIVIRQKIDRALKLGED